MSILVPIILAVALAVSFYGQSARNWQNSNAGQSGNANKSADDSSEDKSGKDKSDDNSKSEKSKNSSAASKAREDAEPKRQK